ncbi:MAG: hypothetical protein ACREA0_07955 [bacterium]
MRWNTPEDLQTRPHLPGWTDALLVSVVTRAFVGRRPELYVRIRPDTDAWFGPSRVRASQGEHTAGTRRRAEEATSNTGQVPEAFEHGLAQMKDARASFDSDAVLEDVDYFVFARAGRAESVAT